MPTPEDPQPETQAHRLRIVDLHDPAGLLAEVERKPDAVGVRFSPVADLRRGIAAGYEALLRVGDREPASPHALSQHVHSQAAGKLEALLVRRVLGERDRLRDNTFVMVNVSGTALCSAELQRTFADA